MCVHKIKHGGFNAFQTYDSIKRDNVSEFGISEILWPKCAELKLFNRCSRPSLLQDHSQISKKYLETDSDLDI